MLNPKYDIRLLNVSVSQRISDIPYILLCQLCGRETSAKVSSTVPKDGQASWIYKRRGDICQRMCPRGNNRYDLVILGFYASKYEVPVDSIIERTYAS